MNDIFSFHVILIPFPIYFRWRDPLWNSAGGDNPQSAVETLVSLTKARAAVGDLSVLKLFVNLILIYFDTYSILFNHINIFWYKSIYLNLL